MKKPTNQRSFQYLPGLSFIGHGMHSTRQKRMLPDSVNRKVFHIRDFYQNYWPKLFASNNTQSFFLLISSRPIVFVKQTSFNRKYFEIPTIFGILSDSKSICHRQLHTFLISFCHGWRNWDIINRLHRRRQRTRSQSGRWKNTFQIFAKCGKWKLNVILFNFVTMNCIKYRRMF